MVEYLFKEESQDLVFHAFAQLIAELDEDAMAEHAEQLNYRIKVEGELDPAWEEWFEGLALSHDGDGNTVLTGPIVDQTALHSLLLKIRDLNLKLISVNEIACNSNEASKDF